MLKSSLIPKVDSKGRNCQIWCNSNFITFEVIFREQEKMGDKCQMLAWIGGQQACPPPKKRGKRKERREKGKGKRKERCFVLMCHMSFLYTCFKMMKLSETSDQRCMHGMYPAADWYTWAKHDKTGNLIGCEMRVKACYYRMARLKVSYNKARLCFIPK